ncbi:GNAT family N-acetyltransferase [Caulobacter segnis]|uniref:GNAT family N-acetyltransferase n=1 Tax=Caulobacter segnis TaxID=88688 RepID=UPI00240FB6CF|nr:GNAT family N-acetyltransferase [Caulobacter segnis]MDG2520810.1 GNAT family N-acetyltransferase [Caulobacter segnis]
MIETERLILRPWTDADREPFAAMCADPEVMRHFPATLNRTESDAVVERMVAHQADHGFSFFALERKADGAFLGFTGMMTLKTENPLQPGVEIGWRLAREAWGAGYASEAALAAIRHGFDTLGLEQIVSFTATENLRSQAVMQRIGMTRRADLDFDHPAVPEGHRLRPHVVYAIEPR